MLSSEPNVEERYVTACSARALTVEARRGGAADALIAGGMPGWGGARFGLALLRLHSEWDALHGARAVRQAGAVKREARADASRGDGADGVAPSPQPKLRSLPELHAQLLREAMRRSIPDPAVKAAQVLAWWLRPVCPTCSGRRWRVVEGTPALSGAQCKGCRGRGVVPVPCGEDGRQLAAFIDGCVDDARSSLRRRLRNLANAR